MTPHSIKTNKAWTILKLATFVASVTLNVFHIKTLRVMYVEHHNCADADTVLPRASRLTNGSLSTDKDENRFNFAWSSLISRKGLGLLAPPKIHGRW